MNLIKNHIIIKDNFFDEKILKEIQKDISNLQFTNRYASKSKLKGDNPENNVYQKIYFSVDLNPEHFAVEEVFKNLKKYFLNNLNLVSSNYFLSSKHEEATPHNDANVDLNCLIYIKGNYLINSGTGFYDKRDNNFVLNTHVGFKENRAIIFDSNIYHTSLQFNKNCGTRYVMANFFDYET